MRGDEREREIVRDASQVSLWAQFRVEDRAGRVSTNRNLKHNIFTRQQNLRGK